jgi:putative ABC transport system permease protein
VPRLPDHGPSRSRPHGGALAQWARNASEASSLAFDALRSQPTRSALAMTGIVIGIVTVVLVATVLAGVRNGIASLFRELGTENVFAFHREGDPYTPNSDKDAQHKPLEPSFALYIAKNANAIRDVAVEIIVPPIVNGRPLVARAGTNESDTALLEGESPNFFDITDTEFRAGRPFTEIEDRVGAKVAVLSPRSASRLRSPATPTTSLAKPLPVRARSSARIATTPSSRFPPAPSRGASPTPW